MHDFSLAKMSMEHTCPVRKISRGSFYKLLRMYFVKVNN